MVRMLLDKIRHTELQSIPFALINTPMELVSLLELPISLLGKSTNYLGTLPMSTATSCNMKLDEVNKVETIDLMDNLRGAVVGMAEGADKAEVVAMGDMVE